MTHFSKLVDTKLIILYCYVHFFIRSRIMLSITITRTIIITGTTIGGSGAG